MDHSPLYSPDQQQLHESRIHLSGEQKSRIREITLGIDTVDSTVLEMAGDDVLKTLENNHPLNRLLENEQKELIGYIACEDFVHGEAYVKYLATSGGTGRNLLREIPEYAKKAGYTKINFHGWNERLNHVLEHFGFTRLRTDTMGELAADFYELELSKVKTSKQVEQERRDAFERKYLSKIRKDYEQTLATFSDKVPDGESVTPRQEKERAITKAYQDLSVRLSRVEGFVFGELQQAVLKLKLARHFQQNDVVDANTLYDALIESPKFLATDKGSLHRVLETHEQKTIQKIAELRRRKAEQTGEEGLNPFEWVCTTASGNYALARLLNMPHLEEESRYMDHCVGTSDSYISKMKRGDVEIFSLRTAPKINPETDQLTQDEPVITIEYNVRTGVIEQMKKKGDDEYLDPHDPFYNDVIDALRQLKGTHTDIGKPRDIKGIAESEVQNLPAVKPMHLLTDQGEVSWEDFAPTQDTLVLKTGTIDLSANAPKEVLSKMLRLFAGLEIPPNTIARSPEEVEQLGASTKAYVGPLAPNIFAKIAEFNIEHIYASFPEGGIRREKVDVGGGTSEMLEEEMSKQGVQFPNVKWMLDHEVFQRSIRIEDPKEPDYRKWLLKPREQMNLIRLTVADLGFPDGATTEQILARAVALGLDLCPPEVGPYYRLQYTDQPMNEWVRIGMKPIPDRGDSGRVFSVERSWLDDVWANPGDHWRAVNLFLFRLRK